MLPLVVSVVVVLSACDLTGGAPPADFPALGTASISNDPLLADQWALPLISATEAWTVLESPALRGDFQRTVVAVLDTSIDLDHEDLGGNVAVADGWDFITDSPFDGSTVDPSRDDIDHGTHVAGIIAALNNNTGIAGLGRDLLTILPIRILDDSVSRSGTLSDLYSGIRYAAGLSNETGTVPSQPAKVINLSLGAPLPPGPPFDLLFPQLIAQLNPMGIVTVASAGNAGTAVMTYPAVVEGVISVGSVDSDRQLSNFSSSGATLDFVAPGGFDVDVAVSSPANADAEAGILSTVFDSGATPVSPGDPDPNYGRLVGTSMSAPYVAALAGLILAYQPSLRATDVYRILAETSEDLGAPNRDSTYGWGLINADRALRRSMMVPFGPFRLDPSVLTGQVNVFAPPISFRSASRASSAAAPDTGDVVPDTYLVGLNAALAEELGTLATNSAMAALSDQLAAIESTDLGGGVWRLRVPPHITEATVQTVMATSDLVDVVAPDLRIGHAGAPVDTPVSFQLTYQGPHSQIAEPGARLYNAVDTLQAEPWFDLLPDDQRERTLRWLDGGRSVVALFAGSRPTGGHHIQVERVSASNDLLDVSYRVRAPDSNLIVTQALTSPYAVLLVDGRFARIQATVLP